MAKRKAPAGTRGTRKNARAKKKPPEVKAAFLVALAECGAVRYACEAVGIGRRTAYNWRDDDEEFAAGWDDALEAAADALEQEAFRRAAVGVEKPIYQGGNLVGTVHEYSDTLLIFLLKGLRPEKYRERVDQRGRMVHSFEGEPEDVLEGAQKRARLKVVPMRKTS